MTVPKQCPKCGRPVDGHAPHALCPACLLGAMLPAENAASRTVAVATEQPGDRIGRYKLREKLGEGGCGTVYVAEQEQPVRRLVALKVIKLGMDTREVIARFEAERQALALMDHPNIARVLDAGATDAGRPYFVMELIKGIRITDYCDQHHLTTEQRLNVFIQVCQAVQHAHQKGIIHRDLKPSNILIASHDGVAVPKVIDFGIAKATQGRLTELTIYTELNQFMGTPAYMSPEQAELSGLDLDTRTDIYALGVLLYQLLTGQTPFDPKKLIESGLDEIRRTIREVEPPKPSTRLNTMLQEDRTTVARCRQTESSKLTSLLRGDLDWIVMKALEKDRTRRYETANGFARDIERFLADEPVSAAAPSAVYRFRKFARRNKTAFAVTSVVAVTLLAATVASTWQAIRATKAESLAGKRLIDVATERESKNQEWRRAEHNAEQNRRQLSVFNVAEGWRLAEAGDLFAAWPRFVEALRLDADDPQRAAVHRTRLGHLAHQFPRLVQVWTAGLSLAGAEISPDGARLLAWGSTESGAGAARVWDLRTGVPVSPLLAHERRVNFASFNSNGTRVVTASADQTARVWDAFTGLPLTAPLMHDGPVFQARFNAGGDQVLTCVSSAGQEGAITLWDVASGEALWHRVEVNVVHLRFSPNGRQFVRGSANTLSALDDVATGRAGGVFPSVPPFCYRLLNSAYSPDGSRLLVMGGFGTAAAENGAMVVDAKTTAPLSGLMARGSAPTVGVFSADGRRVATGSPDGTARVWDAASGEAVTPLLSHRSGVNTVRFSADGRWLATASNEGEARVWDALTGEPFTPPLPTRGAVHLAQFIEGDGQLLTVSGEGLVRTWELRQNRWAAQVWKQARALDTARFTQDGQTVVVGGEDLKLRAWRTTTGAEIWPPIDVGTRVSQLVFSPDTTRVAVPSGKLVVADVAHGRALEGFDQIVGDRDCAFSPDGQRLVAISRNSAQRVRIWEVANGQEHVELSIPGRTGALAFTPDGQRIVFAGAGGRVLVHGAADGVAEGEFSLGVGTINEILFSADGKRALIRADDHAARVWETSAWKPLSPPLRHQGRIEAIQFSPDEKLVLTASQDGTAQLWEAASGQRAAPAFRHLQGVTSAAFSPDGRLVATASSDGSARVWDVQTGQPVTTRLRHGGPVRDVSFRPDGGAVLTASADGTARIWSWPAEARPLADLARLGAVWNASGDFAPLSTTVEEDFASRQQQAWLELRSHYPQTFLPTSPTDTNWQTALARERQAGEFHQVATSLRQGNWTAAVAELSRRLAENPGDADLLLDRARAYLSWQAGSAQGLQDKALEDFDRAASINPGHELALNERSQLIKELKYARDVAEHHWHSELWKKFVANEERRIALKPNDPGPMASLAEQLLGGARSIRDPDRAMSLVRRARELRENIKHDELWGVTLFRFGRWQEAVDTLETAQASAAAKKLTARGLFVLAIGHHHLRHTNEAQAAFDLATARAKTEGRYSYPGQDLFAAEAAAALGKSHSLRDVSMLLEANKLEEALQAQRHAVASSPTDSVEAMRLAVLLSSMGLQAEHEDFSREVLLSKKDTTTPASAERAAKCYAIAPGATNAALLDAALVLARHAVELGRQNEYLAWYQLALGLVEYRRGEYAQAAETLAGAQTSDHPQVRGPALMLHAMTQFRLGQKDDAGKLLTEAETLLGELLQPNPHYSTAGWPDELICRMLHREARQLLDAGTGQ